MPYTACRPVPQGASRIRAFGGNSKICEEPDCGLGVDKHRLGVEADLRQKPVVEKPVPTIRRCMALAGQVAACSTSDAVRLPTISKEIPMMKSIEPAMAGRCVNEVRIALEIMYADRRK